MTLLQMATAVREYAYAPYSRFKVGAAQGGPTDFLERWQNYLPRAAVVRDVFAQTSGYVAAIDGAALGQAVIALAGDDVIDPAVGLTDLPRVGAFVAVGQPAAQMAAERLAPDMPQDTPLIAQRITP